MSNLTLDQAKSIIFSANDADEALASLLDAGSDVVYHDAQCFSVHCGDLDIISFTQLPNSKFMSVAVGVHFFSLEQRKAFLESQQQPTDTVPAVSTVAEARPESVVTSMHSPSDSEWQDISANLFGFFTVLGYVPNRDETFQRVFYGYVCSALGPQKNVFDASLRTLLDALTLTHDRLSTRPVDDTDTELNCFCPTCDYHSATAVMCDPDDPFYHVTCSQCGLDADRQNVWLSPSGLPAHQAELSTESVDKVGE